MVLNRDLIPHLVENPPSRLVIAIFVDEGLEEGCGDGLILVRAEEELTLLSITEHPHDGQDAKAIWQGEWVLSQHVIDADVIKEFSILLA